MKVTGLNSFKVDNPNWVKAINYIHSICGNNPSLFKTLKNVLVVSSPPGQPTSFGIGSISASYMSAKHNKNPGTLYITKDSRTTQIIHELGHVVEDSKLNMLENPIPSKYKDLILGMLKEYKFAKINDDSFSDYAVKNLHEWFAEAFSYIIGNSTVDLSKHYFKTEYPNTYKLIFTLIKDKS